MIRHLVRSCYRNGQQKMFTKLELVRVCLTSGHPDDGDNSAASGRTDDPTTPPFPSTTRTVTVIPGKGPAPEAPVCCCMTGCANCVWLEYARELTEYYRDGGDKARLAIEQLDDENIKAFLRIELKTL